MAGLGFAEKAESLLIRACPERTRHWGSRRNHGKVPPPGEQRVIECWEILRTRSIKVRSTGSHNPVPHEDSALRNAAVEDARDPFGRCGWLGKSGNRLQASWQGEPWCQSASENWGRPGCTPCNLRK